MTKPEENTIAILVTRHQWDTLKTLERHTKEWLKSCSVGEGNPEACLECTQAFRAAVEPLLGVE